MTQEHIELLQLLVSMLNDIKEGLRWVIVLLVCVLIFK